MNKDTPERSSATQKSNPHRQRQAGPSPSFEMVLVLSGLIGAVLNAIGSIWGFVIWLPGNIGLMILNWKRGLKWQALLFAAYTLTAAWGIAAHLLRLRHA
jgi:hypothetical protein